MPFKYKSFISFEKTISKLSIVNILIVYENAITIFYWSSERFILTILLHYKSRKSLYFSPLEFQKPKFPYLSPLYIVLPFTRNVSG